MSIQTTMVYVQRHMNIIFVIVNNGDRYIFFGLFNDTVVLNCVVGI